MKNKTIQAIKQFSQMLMKSYDDRPKINKN